MLSMSRTVDAGKTSVPAVGIRNVSVAFRGEGGKSTLAVENVDFDIPAGQFLALVGPSGCGKTTILNMLAGLMEPSAGAVERGGIPVRGPSKDIGYMLARSALAPWRTTRRNIEIGLELRGVPREERARRSDALIASLELGKFADAYPSQLSHGMQQRVSIARTLAIDPNLWLLDEPFGALDAQTRVRVQSEFLRLWEGSGKTVILVTHDLTEAVLMADRVLVMSARPGRIKLDLPVPLPRPRNLDDLHFDDEVAGIQNIVWEELRHEIK